MKKVEIKIHGIRPEFDSIVSGYYFTIDGYGPFVVHKNPHSFEGDKYKWQVSDYEIGSKILNEDCSTKAEAIYEAIQKVNNVKPTKFFEMIEKAKVRILSQNPHAKFNI